VYELLITYTIYRSRPPFQQRGLIKHSKSIYLFNTLLVTKANSKDLTEITMLLLITRAKMTRNCFNREASASLPLSSFFEKTQGKSTLLSLPLSSGYVNDLRLS
jgi:hypothetical protein